MLIPYLFIRLLTAPLAFLPLRTLHLMGKGLGLLAYGLFPKFRKRALANLSLAYELDLSEKEIVRVAKGSFQTLITTLLEYPKLARVKDISKIAVCENPEEAAALMEKGRGVVFFCGHQANWELLFLEGTSRMPGVAIGRPIKNDYLYRWILSIRQKFGGKIVEPKNGIKEGLRALKKGAFMGIVGDQGMPDSGFSSPFLGRLAWTSPASALLSYKTGAPLIVATTTFKKGRYHIRYSPPLFPDRQAPKDVEVARLMHTTLDYYAESIKQKPEEWLWIHNRWKQQTLEKINKAYRHDSIALVAKDVPEAALALLRTLFPTEELTHIKADKPLPKSYRYKLVFDMSSDKATERHFKRYAQTYRAIRSIEEIEPLCLKTASS